MKTAVVTGTRRDTRHGAITKALDEFDPERVIVGDATGVDKEARDWTMAKGKRLIMSPAPWDARGYSAGPFRNETLAETAAVYLLADYDVRAFVVPDAQSKGTYDAKKRFEHYHIPVTVL